MSDWKAKRFWKSTRVEPVENGFAVRLDDRALRTPAKAELCVPSRALAAAIAAEWDAQSGEVDPQTMPVTRAANAAIDKVTPQFREVADMLAAYGDSDLTCYRAPGPAELVARQCAAWDPLLDWAADRYGARLIPVEGVVHIPQSQPGLRALAAPLYEMNPFELTAMHDLVSISGSLIIGLAASEGAFEVSQLWSWSRIDEIWQQEQWGEDDEAMAMAAHKEAGFVAAARFLELTRRSS